MNNELVKIGDVEIPVKEYHGQRVVTFKDIDQCHGRPEGTAGRNFRANRKHMIESTDFFQNNSRRISSPVWRIGFQTSN
mgnify:CR=1 FL=1